MHLAAESHVDRSISNPLAFAKTNILGTMILLNSFKNEFDDQSEFNKMFKFMNGFFEIIEDDKKFNKQIVDKARTK